MTRRRGCRRGVSSPSPRPGPPFRRAGGRAGGRGAGAGGAWGAGAGGLGKLAGQGAPRVMRAGFLVTLRAPVPVLETVGVKVGVKVAVTVVAAEMVAVQAPVPEQPPPLQPLKIEPAAGAAVSVTAVPLAKLAAQVAPQVIPAGELVTVPLPVPAGVTVRMKV